MITDPTPNTESQTLSLQLDQRRVTPREAKLELHISTEYWDETSKSWIYQPSDGGLKLLINVNVDEDSGEDGAAQPSLCLWLDETLREKIATPPQWPGLDINDESNQCADAWYGNDAPELKGNRVRLGRWHSPQKIHLHWSAHYWGPPDKTLAFLFTGPVDFCGIRISLKDPADLELFLAHSLPTLQLSNWDVVWSQWRILPDYPEDRQRWINAQLMPKPT